jgi:secreted Zn-dependent insulinase-like peptidase
MIVWGLSVSVILPNSALFSLLLILITYLAYLGESIFYSSTFRYLRSMSELESFVDYIEKLRAASPSMNFHMECFRMESTPYTEMV